MSARERILVWLAEGAREVVWALCSMPADRWATPPPAELGAWPVVRHIRHLALHERELLQALNGGSRTPHADDRSDPDTDAEALVRDLSTTRFDLLQRLEAAPDAAWHASTTSPRLDTLLLRARQHELEHLADIWRIALYWDRASFDKLPLHPADRFSEGVTLR